MIGKHVSHYRIIEKLGSGGMGVVYRAHDEKLDRTVALKFLPRAVGDGDVQRRRFVREARAASALDHPNICTVYEIDETDDGQIFIALSYCGGASLDKQIARGPIPVDVAVNIATQIARGLAGAHKSGVVHRDIKPANIMVTDEGAVKIVDFGLAKLTRRTALTMEGTTMGTPAYMSPEQARGEDVDSRTDTWALGVVLYEMLTGKAPFVAGHDAAVIQKIQNEPHKPISSSRRDVPAPLESIVDKALAKDPAERFSSMDEMIAALNGCQSEEGSGAVCVELERARSALANQDWQATIAAFGEADAKVELTAEDLEGWALAAVWLNRFDVSVSATERAHAKHLKSGRLGAAARGAINLADYNLLTGARSVCNGWIKRAEKILEKIPDSLETGYLARLRGRIAIEADCDLSNAAEFTDRAMEFAERYNDSDLRTLALQDRGRILVLQNKVEEGMALLDEAMAAAISGELSPIVVGSSYCNMITTCDKIADYKRAAEWSDQAVRWCEPHSESGFHGICSVRRAGLFTVRGDWESAEIEAEQAAKKNEQTMQVVAAEAYCLIGEIKLRRGRYEEAERSFQDAHAKGRHPLPGLALLRLRQGRGDAAQSLISRALQDTTLELDRIRLLPAAVEIAVAVGDLTSARAHAEELSQLAAHLNSSVFVARAAHSAGAVALAENNDEDALSLLRDACQRWRDADMPYDEARTRLLLATAYMRQSEKDLAELDARAARAVFERLGATVDLTHADDLLTDMQ